MEVAFLAARPQADGANLVDDLRVERHHVAIEHREDGIEVHVGPVFAHDDGDDALGGALREQRPGDLLDHAPLGPLAHPDQHRPVADRLHVTAFERGPAEVGHIELALIAQRRVPPVRTRRRGTSGGTDRSPAC